MSEDIERTLIAQITYDPSIIDEHLITDSLFESEKYRSMFNTIQAARREYGKIDQNAIYLKLKEINEDDALDYIAIQPLSTANAKFYVDHLKERNRIRKIEKAILTGNDMLRNKLDTSTSIANAVMSMLNSALNEYAEEKTSIKDIAFEYLDELNERISDRRSNKIVAPRFDLHKLDTLCDQIKDGEIVVIAGRPGAGKTALALQFIRNAVLKYKIPCAIFSLEMLQEEIIDRLVAQSGVCTVSALRGGYVSNDQIDDVNNIVGELYASSLYIYDYDSDITKITARIRRDVAINKVKIVMIDYVGLIKIDTHSNIPRWQQIGEISRGLKLLAKELKIIIVEVVQLTREGDGVEPTLGMLRDSGSIEQDSSRVILLHEPRRQEGLREFVAIVAKNRYGPIGRAKLLFDGQHVTFRDAEDS